MSALEQSIRKYAPAPARRRSGIQLVPTCDVFLSPPAPPLPPARRRPWGKISSAVVDKHKTSTEENKNPVWEDEEDKDPARKEVKVRSKPVPRIRSLHASVLAGSILLKHHVYNDKEKNGAASPEIGIYYLVKTYTFSLGKSRPLLSSKETGLQSSCHFLGKVHD